MTSIILMPTFACFLKFLSTIYAPKETKVLCEKWGSLGWYDKKKKWEGRSEGVIEIKC